MTKKADSEISDIEQIINEYKQGISRAIEEEKGRFEELSNVLASSQNEAKRLVTEAQEQAQKITEDIIAQAEQKAQQIINTAEEAAKNEARKKTQLEVEKIKKAARDKAAELIAKARQMSEKTTNSITAQSKQEADKLIKRLTEQARREAEHEAQDMRKKAHAEAEQIIRDARNTAKEEGEKEMARITAAAKQVAEQAARKAREKVKIEKDQLMTGIASSTEITESTPPSDLPESRNMAGKIAVNIDDKVPAEPEDSTPELMEAQKILAEVFGNAINETEETRDESNATPLHNIFAEENEYPAINKMKYEAPEPAETENRAIGHDEKLELHIMPASDFSQVSKFEKQLLQVPDSLQLLSKGGSEGGIIWLEVNYSDSLPIEDLLRQISPVKEVARYGNYITVYLNDS